MKDSVKTIYLTESIYIRQQLLHMHYIRQQAPSHALMIFFIFFFFTELSVRITIENTIDQNTIQV